MANLATINNNLLADSGIDPLSVVLGSGTANQIAYWIDADNIGALTTATYPSLTELSYVKGVTSAIQTQIDAKLSLSGGTMTGQIVLKNVTNSTDYTGGLRFPNDPFGGSGDISGLRLYRDGASGEKMVLELYVGNDGTSVSQDRINFATGVGGTPDNDLVTINGNKIWNSGNLPSPQSAITLTTTGTSGAATLIGATLNIPQYQSVLTNPVTGTGTANYVTKWSSTSAVTDSLIQDNGTNVWITKEDSYLGIDAQDLTRLGFVKKQGAQPFIGYAQDPLVIASTTATSISTVNTFVNRVTISTAGIVTFLGDYVSFNNNGYIRGDATGWLSLQGGTNGTRIRNAGNSSDYLTINNTGAATFSSTVTAAGYRITGDNVLLLNSINAVQNQQVQFQNNGTLRWQLYLNATNDSFNIYNSSTTSDSFRTTTVSGLNHNYSYGFMYVDKISGAAQANIRLRTNTDTYGTEWAVGQPPNSTNFGISHNNGTTWSSPYLTLATTGRATFSNDVQVNGKLGAIDDQGLFLRGVDDVTHKLYYKSTTTAGIILEINNDFRIQYWNANSPVTRFTFGTNGDFTSVGSVSGVGFNFNVGARTFKSYSYGSDLVTSAEGGWAQSHRIYNTLDTANTWFIGVFSGTFYIKCGDPATTDVTGYNATSGFTVSTTGAATFSSSVTASSIIKSGGTASQYLMADGSVSTLTNPVTGTGNNNYIAKFTTTGSTVGNSLLQSTATGVFINQENTFFGVDAQALIRLGFTKKSGFNPYLSYAETPFVIASTAGTSIAASNTFTPRLTMTLDGDATFAASVTASNMYATTVTGTNNSGVVGLYAISSSVNGAGIYIDNSTRTSGRVWSLLNGNSSNGTFSIKDETANVARFLIDSGGTGYFKNVFYVDNTGNSEPVIRMRTVTDSYNTIWAIGQVPSDTTFGLRYFNGTAWSGTIFGVSTTGVATFVSTLTAVQLTGSGEKPQLIANGGTTAGAQINLNTSLSTSPTLRRNWCIATEDQVEGDFVIKRSNVAGGAAITTTLSILSNGNATFSNTLTAAGYRISGNNTFLLNSTATQSQQIHYQNDGTTKWQLYLNRTDDSFNIFNSALGTNSFTVSSDGSVQANGKVGTIDNQGIFLRGNGDATHKLYYKTSIPANIWEYNAPILFQHYNSASPVTRFTFDTGGNFTAVGSVTGVGFNFGTGARTFKSYTYGTDLTVNTTGGWAQSHRIYNEADTTKMWFFGAVGTTAYIKFGDPAVVDATGYAGIGMALSSTGAVYFDTSMRANQGFIGQVPTYGSANIQFSHIDRTGAGEYSFLSASDGTTFINSKTSTNTHIRVNNSTIATFFSDGNLRVGTSQTNSGNKFQVDGNAYIGGTGFFTSYAYTSTEGTGFMVDANTNATQARVGLMKYPGWEGMLISGASTVIRLAHRTDSEYVFGGTASIRVDLLIAANGAATFSSSVTAQSFFEGSDMRIKELIEDNYRSKDINSIKPKLYNKNGKIELGYYAQDVQPIMQHAVSVNEDGYLTLSYREVHTAKIAYLEDSIEEIKAKILYLENQLKSKQ